MRTLYDTSMSGVVGVCATVQKVAMTIMIKTVFVGRKRQNFVFFRIVDEFCSRGGNEPLGLDEGDVSYLVGSWFLQECNRGWLKPSAL